MPRTKTTTVSLAAAALLAMAGPGSAGALLLFDGEADVVGRTRLGMTVPLGNGPFTLTVDIADIDQSNDPNAPLGISAFGDPFTSFEIDIPVLGRTLGGGTTDNFAQGSTNGPDPDSVTLGVLDCINDNCGFPLGELNNPEALAFEGMFLRVDLPDSTLSGGLGTMGDVVTLLEGLDFSSTTTFFNASYVPESLIGPQLVAEGQPQGAAEVLFVAINGNITDARLVPEPASVMCLVAALLALGVIRRRR